MRVRYLYLLLLSFPFLHPARANAQLSAYGTLSVSDYGYSFNGNGLTISPDRVGFQFGALYDFRVSSRVNLGIDGRGNVTPGTRGGAKGFASARVAFIPHQNPFRPYFQAGVGEIHARVPQSSFTVGAQSINKFGVDLALGLDVRLNHSLDYRILELESGAGFDNGHGTNAGSASVSTGIVYHFPNTRLRNP